jgi:putative hydroxymethylpyrimidine transport system permease protein
MDGREPDPDNAGEGMEWKRRNTFSFQSDFRPFDRKGKPDGDCLVMASMQRGGGFLLFAAMILVWQAAVALFQPAPFLLPSPVRVATALYENRSFLAVNAAITLGEMLLGFAVGCLAGTGIALLMAQSSILRRILLPPVITSQTLPVFAIAPILVIWFGFGVGSKVAMAALIIFFPVASTFHDGLMRVDRQWLDLARGWGAGNRQLLMKVRIPAALPSLASGCKIGATLAPIGAIVGEWAGASGGLGYVMLQANARMETELVFASLVLLAAMALLLRFVVAAGADRLVFWQAVQSS